MTKTGRWARKHTLANPAVRSGTPRRASALHVDGADVWRWLALLAIAAKVWVAILVFDPRAHDVFALPKSAAGIAASLVLVAVVVAYLRRSQGPIWVRSPLHWFVLAYLGANTVAAVFALDSFVAVFGAPGHYLGLTTLADLAILYLGVALLLRRERDVARLGLLVLLAAGPLITYEVAQRAKLDPIRWSMPEAIFSTLGNPNVLGGFLAVMAVAAIAALAFFWADLRPATRAALVVLALECAAAVLYTGTRASLLGLVVGAVALVVFAFHLALRVPRRVAVGIAGACLGLGVIATPLVGSTLVGERLRDLTRFDASTQERLYLWRSALQLIAARPLLGVGPDNFVVGYPAARAPETARISGADTLSRSAHSWVLRIATDAGLAGLAAYLALLAAGAWFAWRARTRVAAFAMATLAAHLGQGVVAVDHVGVDWVPWLALGLVASLPGSGNAFRGTAPDAAAPAPASSKPGMTAAGRSRGTASAGLALDATVLGLAVLGGLLAWQSVRASEALLQSSLALARGDGTTAVAKAQEAIRLDPQRAAYWHGLGVVHSAAGRMQQAVDAFQRAAELNWYQSDSWRNLAIAHLKRFDAGEKDAGRAALAAAERAVAVEPSNAVAHFVLGRVLLGLGEDERAAAEGERAVAIVPSEEYFELLGIAYVNLKRWEDAERVVVPRVAANPVFRLLAAHVYAGTGRVQLAKEQLQQYLQARPGDPGALALLRRIQSQ